MISMRLLETELENDEMGRYLMDLFKAKDVEITGVLSWESIRDVLHQAMLGLSMMQIYTVISEAQDQTDGQGMIAYAGFIPRAVGMIKSMLSFERSVNSKNSHQSIGEAAEKHFNAAMDQAFPSGSASAAEIGSFLESSQLMQHA